MTKIRYLFDRYRNFILYAVIGGFCATLDFCIFSLLVCLGVELLISNAIGIVCGIVTSFTLNRLYNFKTTDHTWRRFAQFFIIGIIGLAVSTLMLDILTIRLGFNEFYSKLSTIAIVSILQFTLNKIITFKPTNDEERESIYRDASIQ